VQMLKYQLSTLVKYFLTVTLCRNLQVRNIKLKTCLILLRHVQSDLQPSMHCQLEMWPSGLKVLAFLICGIMKEKQHLFVISAVNIL